jgi:hypothetical protein
MSQALSGIVISYLANRGNYEKLKEKYVAFAKKELSVNDNEYPDAAMLIKIANYLEIMYQKS